MSQIIWNMFFFVLILIERPIFMKKVNMISLVWKTCWQLISFFFLLVWNPYITYIITYLRAARNDVADDDESRMIGNRIKLRLFIKRWLKSHYHKRLQKTIFSTQDSEKERKRKLDSRTKKHFKIFKNQETKFLPNRSTRSLRKINIFLISFLHLSYVSFLDFIEEDLIE